VASRGYCRNDIVRAGDDHVTGAHQGLRISHGEFHVETPILFIIVYICRLPAASFGGIEPSFQGAINPKPSARSAAFSRDARAMMRLLVHVLTRLAITATCTNSAAALEVQAVSPETSFVHQQSVGVSDVEFSIGDRRYQALQHPGTGPTR
jgi:hypothetical protein